MFYGGMSHALLSLLDFSNPLVIVFGAKQLHEPLDFNIPN